MVNSLKLIRGKITELEAKLTDLRIAERELVDLRPLNADSYFRMMFQTAWTIAHEGYPGRLSGRES